MPTLSRLVPAMLVATISIAHADELPDPDEPPPTEPDSGPSPTAPSPTAPDTTESLPPAPPPSTTTSAPAQKAPTPAPGNTLVAATDRVPVPSSDPDALGPRWAPWQVARLAIELELTTQARLAHRTGDDLSELRLERGELGGRIALGHDAAAELRFEAIRSAVEGGSLGIDGDSTVFRLKTAQVIGTHRFGDADGALRIDGAIGFVPDPWIRTREDDDTLEPLSRTGSERLLGWPTSDLAGVIRGSVGPARATVAIGNGEGLQFPERNTGKTTTAVLEVAPIATRTLRLTIAGVVRDGSIGVASIRDRRYGGGVIAVSPRIRGGAEVVFAQGIGDVGEAEGLLVGGWADARFRAVEDVDPAPGFGETPADAQSADAGTDDADARSSGSRDLKSLRHERLPSLA